MINKFITGVFIIFGLAVCLSEPFSRHCVKALLILTLLRCSIKPAIVLRLNDIKILLTGILLFVGVMFISCIYGGNFVEEIRRYRFLMHYNALLVPAAVLALDSEFDVRRIMLAAFTGLFITDIYIIY